MADWKLSSEMGFEFEDFSLADINEKVLPLAYKNMKKEEYAYYDIVLLNGNFVNPKTAECKFDEMGSITGNICIEVGCWGRQSGLLITKADYWIISDGNITFIIETQRIHDCIVENMDYIEYRKKERVSQGKGKYKEMDMYLIPKRYFEPYCCEIGNVDEMKYTCLV
jgi:hypothetical protein